ncbi:MAG TPA: late competence development ComFB family protein [Spirochaetota bacterium]|nr:late competence development ComFB family protein [Spirochaetota bacterium]HPJ42578.1 late competence development ComFB family protein [Spirochaetota bacterium]HRX47244.1 late competence development ComFB family protein [Spirochaetota bacterium]
MEFFNLIEVIVKDIVDEVLKKDEALHNLKIHRNDIIAYILNRVPPRYVTGERGIIHTRIDPRLKFQQHTDILFLTYEAIELFSKRRETEVDENEIIGDKTAAILPHMIGEALEETTLSVIPDLKITLLYNDEPAHMMDSGWKNPYHGTKATRGYFHFWPKYMEKDMKDLSEIEFRVKFEHPKFDLRTVKVNVKSGMNNNPGTTQSIPLVLMKLKDGVSADFLKED